MCLSRYYGFHLDKSNSCQQQDFLVHIFVLSIYIYLTAIGLTPGGSSTVHIYTKTVHRAKQLSNWEECVPYHVLASYTLAFALKLRKKRGKTSGY